MDDHGELDPRDIEEGRGTLVRFSGVMREDHHFIHVPAWETARVIERPGTGDGSYVVDLVDREGKVVSRASPSIDFREVEDPDLSGLRLADVLVYVPMHPSARLLVFHRVVPDELEIYRADVASRPPRIGELLVDGEPPGWLRLRWRSEHAREMTFTVFYWPDQGNPYVLASGLRENGFEVAGDTLPGPTGRFAVLASDGIRSSVAVGRPLEGFSSAIRIRITAPDNDSLLPPDHPINLHARVEDLSGTPVAVDELVWSIDGEQVAFVAPAAVRALDPGEHEIEVAGLRASERDRDVVRVTVANRNQEQDAFAQRVAQLPPLAERRAETSE